MKHTQGPWLSDGESVMADTEEYKLVTVVYPCAAFYDEKKHKTVYTGNDREIRKANSNLIAAAPELLEALELVMSNSTNFRLHAPKGMIDKIETAIAKAKGESCSE